MSRYVVALKNVEAMRTAVLAAALTKVQQSLLDLVTASGKGALLTEIARNRAFRGVHYATIIKAAEALRKKKKIVFDGKFVTTIDFPPAPMDAAVSAAKDIGDGKGDKKRKATISDLVKRSTLLQENVAADGFPEVTEAAKTVASLADFLGRMDTASARLKSAPAGSSEAVEAQKLIDSLRMGADTMIPSLAVTMETLENLVEVASEMEAQFAALSAQVKVMDEKLKKEKARLAAAANAVQNAVKLA